MPAANSGWNDNMTYLRRELEKAMAGLTLEVKPSKPFKRWKPEDVAKADLRDQPGRPRLFEVGEFPYSPNETIGNEKELHVVESKITVWYPTGGPWMNVIVSDYRIIRDHLLDTFRSEITMPDLSYCILDALAGIDPEPTDEPRGRWVEYPLQTAVYITGG